jgi:hypothetical protein
MTVKAKPAVKRATAAPAKRAAKPVVKDPAAPVISKPKAAKAEKPAKGDKAKKVKMVRDSFTMPETEYAQLAELKKKCLQAGVHVKKSELLRAGLLGLARLSEAALLKAVDQVEKIKTGRPAKQ